jgi:hypothetical protein
LDNLGTVEVGVEIVYDDVMTGNLFHNVPKIGKVRADLSIYRRVLLCPMWVIGLRRDAEREPGGIDDIV